MIGERINRILNESGLKKVEFAKAIGIDQSYVPKIISGEKKPSDRVIDCICSKFNVNKEWILSGDGEPYNPPEDEEAAYISELLEDVDDPVCQIIKAVMKTYRESGEKERIVLKSFAKDLMKQIKKESRD